MMHPDLPEDIAERTLFRLNALDFLPAAHNHHSTAVSIRSLLAGDEVLVYSVQFTYEVELAWLVQQYAPRFRAVPMLLVTGAAMHGSLVCLHRQG